MNINKKIQKLMPRGVELIIQGRTIKINNIDIKLLIRKKFSGKLNADYWYDKQMGDIKNVMGIVERIAMREERE